MLSLWPHFVLCSKARLALRVFPLLLIVCHCRILQMRIITKAVCNA